MTDYSVPQLLDGAGFQIATIVICISCLYYTLMRAKPDKVQSKLFVWLLCNIAVSAVCNLVSAVMLPHLRDDATAFFLHHASQYIYFVVHVFLPPVFCVYIMFLTGLNYRLRRRDWVLFAIPEFITVVMAVVNPVANWIFGYDENHNYHRNPGIYIVYVICLGYFIAAIIITLFLWNILSRKKKLVMVYFFVVVAVGTAVQLFMMPAHTELFSQAIAMTGIMVTIENEEGLRDARTRIYNHAALDNDLQMFFRINRSFCMIIVKTKNPAIFSRFTGQHGIEALTEMTGDFLATLVPRSCIYYSGIGTFVIICNKNDLEYNLELSRNILKRFEHSWHLNEKDIKLGASVYCAQVPKDFDNLEEILMLVNSPAQTDNNTERDIVCGEGLHSIIRQGHVESAIMNGLENKNFEVYYQPIYNMGDLSICACEALTRLHDAERGDIYPDEFLPLAERSGLIFDIGDFVLNEVCKFLNSGIPTEMGIETINVNMSVTQCLQPGHAERIINIVSKYDISPSRIMFEITEAAAVADFEELKKFVNILREHGFGFCIDNYGFGYSNISLTFSLDVSLIKIDKSILWEAERSQVGRIIMESTIATIKRLGKKILVTGVENKKQIDMATEFEVNLLQGYYFSNPLGQNELISILKATQLARFEEQKALAASEAMSNFLASMSHEIRTPINAVLGMDEMILRECGDGKILEYAKNIEGAGRTLLSLINDILELSKLEAGNFEIAEAGYELSSLVSDVVNMIQFKADSKGLRLKVEVDPETPESLSGDETRIRQILLNLMNNAVKYTDRGSVSLNVGFEKISKSVIKLMFSISDTGIGIKDEDIQHLFDKFKRLDIDKNKTVEGSGLGLAITSQLIRNMNGTIDVKSTYGLGSTFYVAIPQKVIDPAAVGSYKKATTRISDDPERNIERFHAPKGKILIVDDTQMNLVVARELLKRTQIQIDEAMSGQECLNLLEDNVYDIIFLDYRMPNMDGIEVLNRIRAMTENPNCRIPVLALTANAISGAREKFIGEGFDDYITKPVDGLKLEKMLLIYLPKEKIEFNGPEPATEYTETVIRTEQAPSEDETDEELENILDKEAGIRNCGSADVYSGILQIFIDDIENKTSTIRDALENNDIERYTVEVHSLKSSARIVGAMAVSKLAAALEKAGEKVDMDTINADTEKLLEMYGELREQSGLEKEPETDPPVRSKEEKTDTDGRPENAQADNSDDQETELTPDMWKDALVTLKEFAGLMDYDNAALVLRSLKGYRMDDGMRKQSDSLRALTDALKWEQVIEQINTILDEKGI